MGKDCVMAKKILLIDDEPEFINSLSARLENSGFETLSARDGPSGIEKAKKEKPDLVILDWDLQGENGYEVANKLAVGSAAIKVPVLVLSSIIHPDLPKSVLDAGAIGYLLKPVDHQSLFKVLKAVLDK